MRYFKLFGSLLTVIALSSCSIQSNRISKNDDLNHPAMDLFLAYEASVHAASSFLDVKPYFTTSDQKAIKTALGWRIFVFSSSYLAIKDGDCKQLYLSNVSLNRAMVNCIGAYRLRISTINGVELNEEKMHMKVFANERNGQWFIGQSGFRHSSTGAVNYAGDPVTQSKGRKFSDYAF